MHKADKENTAFMTEHANHRYNAMPFGLKKAGEVHQRMMNNIFEGEIRITLEVHMDYMIIKSTKRICMKVISNNMFNHEQKYNTRLNQKMCTLSVKADTNLGF